MIGEEECLDIVSAGRVHEEVEELCHSVALVHETAGRGGCHGGSGRYRGD